MKRQVNHYIEVKARGKNLNFYRSNAYEKESCIKLKSQRIQNLL